MAGFSMGLPFNQGGHVSVETSIQTFDNQTGQNTGDFFDVSDDIDPVYASSYGDIPPDELAAHLADDESLPLANPLEGDCFEGFHIFEIPRQVR